MSCGGTEEKLPRASEAKIDLDGLRRVIARREPGLPNLCRLPVGCKARSEHPLHITLGGEKETTDLPT